MHRCNNDYAAKTAIALAEENIKAAGMWIPQENVIDFIEGVYNYLVSGNLEKGEQ